MLADSSKPASYAKTNGTLNLVCGAGGSRAVLGSSGMILACHTAGIDIWRTAGGVSGGSIPSLLVAAGVHPAELVKEVVATDFADMLTPLVSMPKIWWAFFLKECAWKRRSTEGVLGSSKVGQFVEKFSPRWPENYWTVAVADQVPILFSHKGVFELLSDGNVHQISKEPAPVGLIIRASCAVPGIIEAVTYNGSHLLDGGLYPPGRCPVAIAKQHFGAQAGSILACDVGEDSPEASRKEHIFFKILREIVCGPCCDPELEPPTDFEGVVLVKPTLEDIESLKFVYNTDEKWQAIMSGFAAATRQIKAASLCSEQELAKAAEVVAAYSQMKLAARKTGELASMVEGLLKSKGLY